MEDVSTFKGLRAQCTTLTHNLYESSPSLKILFFYIFGFETLFGKLFNQGEKENIVICGIDDLLPFNSIALV